jgi:hypothetical protein
MDERVGKLLEEDLKERPFATPRERRHALVALEDLRDELALTIPWDLQAFDLTRRGQEVALVVSVSLSSPGVGVSSR